MGNLQRWNMNKNLSWLPDLLDVSGVNKLSQCTHYKKIVDTSGSTSQYYIPLSKWISIDDGSTWINKPDCEPCFHLDNKFCKKNQSIKAATLINRALV